ADILTGKRVPFGYDAVKNHVSKDRYPEDIFVLFAEAAVAGIPTETVERDIPRARAEAEHINTWFKKAFPDLMEGLPFRFDTSQADQTRPDPTRTLVINVSIGNRLIESSVPRDAVQPKPSEKEKAVVTSPARTGAATDLAKTVTPPDAHDE